MHAAERARRSRARGRVGPVLHLGDRVGIVGQPPLHPQAAHADRGEAQRPSGSSAASTMRATVPTSVRTSSPPTSLPRSISTTPNSRVAGQAVVHQRPVARLEHVQRQPGGGHEHRARAGTSGASRQPSSTLGPSDDDVGDARPARQHLDHLLLQRERRRRGRAREVAAFTTNANVSGGSSSSTIPARDATDVSEPVLAAQHALQRRCRGSARPTCRTRRRRRGDRRSPRPVPGRTSRSTRS